MLCFLTITTIGQARLKLAASGRLTFGAFYNSIENTGEEKWRSSIAPVITLEPSIKLRWKNSFSLSFGGGFNLYNYEFSTPGYNYVVSYIGLKTESILNKYFYLGGTFEYITIGCGVGYTFHSNNQLQKQEGGYHVLTDSHKSRPLFISPQIGTYKRYERFGYSLMLQFTYMYSDDPFITFDLSSTNSEATSSHLGNYLGLNLIVDYDLRKKEKSTPNQWEKDLPDDHLARELKQQGKMDFKSRRITINVWDYGIIDNDTISFTLNDKVVLSNYKITHDKKKIKIKLEPGENILKMVAHNEGSVKPNSAALEIRSGFGKKAITLNSTMNSTAIINLNYLYKE